MQDEQERGGKQADIHRKGPGKRVNKDLGAGPAAALGLKTFDLGVAPSLAPHTQTLTNLQGGPGISAPHCSRGCAFGDFDNDGDLDILVVNLGEPPSLLRNDLRGAHHWLKIKLVGTKSNRSAIGARVLARYGRKMQAQEVLSQSSYLSVSDSRLHFGLGPVKTVDIEIRWPLGLVEKLTQVPADRLIYVVEGSGIVRTQEFARKK